MKRVSLDVVGIGNAIVDVIARADDEFLYEHAMIKGGTALLDEARAEELYRSMGSTIVSAGGSAANTIAGIASFGGKTGYIGKLRDDALGREFRHAITSIGVTFPTAYATDGPATARCLIFVTPDGQRAVNTYLGACVNLGPGDIDATLIESAQVTYLEGYLFDPPHAQAAFRSAAVIAHGAARKVSLSLSDAFCVNRHRTAFLSLVDHHVDVLFANESEITALYSTRDLATAVSSVRRSCDLAAITCGVKGSIVVTPDETIEIAAAPVARVVDTTGAGELYAAGFLFGLTSGASLAECGRLGSIAAAEIVSHVGSRPETPLKALAAVR